MAAEKNISVEKQILLTCCGEKMHIADAKKRKLRKRFVGGEKMHIPEVSLILLVACCGERNAHSGGKQTFLLVVACCC